MRSWIWMVLLIGLAIGSPRWASAQCGDMSGHAGSAGASGHGGEHAAAVGDVDEKSMEKARKLLKERKTRSALVEAILEDASFARMLLVRLLDDPEYRAWLEERLDVELGSPGGPNTVGESRPARPSPAYRCPMHPDATSDRAGRCPECGMDLERVPEPAEE